MKRRTLGSAIVAGLFLIAFLAGGRLSSQTEARQEAPLVDALFPLSGLHVEGSGMLPALADGNVALVDRRGYQTRPVQRGAIVVFDPGLSTDKPYVKRVVGLPNESVEIREDGLVYVDGDDIDEPYLDDASNTACAPDACGPWTLGADEVFVLGDDRPNSTDSRIFGPIKLDTILGEVVGVSTLGTAQTK